jgi:hypothetical protein
MPLQISTHHVGNPRYIALSYCWGALTTKQRLFQTTNSNYGARVSGFDITELPKTLQDAVKVARGLGIDYIWIDAICIIQDNDKDWAREAAQMNKVYSHAFLTVAAATSRSSLDGFLKPRRGSCQISLGFSFTDLQPLHSPTALEEIGTIHFRYPLERHIKDHLEVCEWNKRGWTLQERYLSSRILYFTEDVLYFECATSQNVENPGYKLPGRLRLPMLLAESKILTDSEQKDRREEYLSNWYQVVSEYSERILGRPSDKLPAIEGLAAVLREVIDDTYWYGLWNSDLHRGLLWAAPASWIHPRGGYRAPTWSWASRDGCVIWDPKTFEPGWESMIEHHKISPPQECSHCNQFQGVRLELIAPVAPLRDVLQAFLGPNGSDEHLDDWGELKSWDDDFADLGSVIIDDNNNKPWISDTQMMLIAKKAENQNFQAILIQPCSNSNYFKRIGHFIQKPTRTYESEETGESEEMESEDGMVYESFEPIRAVFALAQRTLV